MYTRRAIQISIGLVLLVALLIGVQSVLPQAGTPSVEVIKYSFSVAAGDPLAAIVKPADILSLSGMIQIPCEQLGLLCADPVSGAFDDLGGLSFGSDFLGSESMVIHFSVGRGSQGSAGSAVRVEASCSTAEPHEDVFASTLLGANQQALDGNGTACSTNSGSGLFIQEGMVSDNLDALERDPCLWVDLDCDHAPEGMVFFSLKSGSPSLAYYAATPADILVTASGYAPQIWASGSSDLGLVSNDQIDALCIRDDGDGAYSPADQVLFSLAPGSPTLIATGYSAADLLRPKRRPGVTAAQMGLLTSDNLDAAVCIGEFKFYDLYLPLIKK